MNKVETGYELIYRYENVITDELCDKVYDYMINQKNIEKTIDSQQMPWHEGDTLAYNNINNQEIKNIVKECKYKVNDLIMKEFNQVTYPHFSDLVLWRKGRKMWWHKDNGYELENNIFEPRVFSAVCYMNDAYSGGETLIKQGENIYTSNPKKGSVVIFTSDERCEHRVAEVTEGTRLTLAMWFTTNKIHQEVD